MLTALLKAYRFHVVKMLQPGASFNASWFINHNVVPLLGRFFPGGRDARRRQLVIHIANGSAHNASAAKRFFEQNPLKTLP
jgi:hypothetical protein